MGKVRLNVLGLSYSQTQTGAYALLLTEEDGSRRLPVVIGAVEAQSIAIQLENVNPPRPLTHDLFKKFATFFDVTVVEANIFRVEEGVFYAEIICEKDMARISIDSRTSDAVAIALRFGCPIYAEEEVMEKASIIVHPEKGERATFEKKTIDPLSKYQNYSVEQLKEFLQKAIEEENYEEASQIRDAIKQKSK